MNSRLTRRKMKAARAPARTAVTPAHRALKVAARQLPARAASFSSPAAVNSSSSGTTSLSYWRCTTHFLSRFRSFMMRRDTRRWQALLSQQLMPASTSASWSISLSPSGRLSLTLSRVLRLQTLMLLASAISRALSSSTLSHQSHSHPWSPVIKKRSLRAFLTLSVYSSCSAWAGCTQRFNDLTFLRTSKFTSRSWWWPSSSWSSSMYFLASGSPWYPRWSDGFKTWTSCTLPRRRLIKAFSKATMPSGSNTSSYYTLAFTSLVWVKSCPGQTRLNFSAASFSARCVRSSMPSLSDTWLVIWKNWIRRHKNWLINWT